MFVGARVLQQCRGMDAGLGGEGRGTDIGRLGFGRAVQQLVEIVGKLRQALQRLAIDAGLEALVIGGLQQKRRYDGDEIGVAAAFADAVQRALDLAHAGFTAAANWPLPAPYRYAHGCRAGRRGRQPR